MCADVDYSLYLVTDRALMRADTLEDAVLRAVRGGVTMVQLREKDIPARDFYQSAVRIGQITRAAGVPLLVNDRADIALCAGADGVHIGQNDLPARRVRAMIGKKIMGVSVSTEEEAVKAARDGADYLGVGAMYPTGTKKDARIVDMAELARIRAAVSIPIVVIGGINERTAKDFKNTGVDGFSVVSAIIGKDDIEGAAKTMLRLFRGTKNA